MILDAAATEAARLASRAAHPSNGTSLGLFQPLGSMRPAPTPEQAMADFAPGWLNPVIERDLREGLARLHDLDAAALAVRYAPGVDPREGAPPTPYETTAERIAAWVKSRVDDGVRPE